MSGTPYRDQVPKAHRNDPPPGCFVAVLVLIVAMAAGFVWLGQNWGDDDPMPCKADQVYEWVEYPDSARCVPMPESGVEITDSAGNVDRWADYTRCVQADEVPNEDCPTPSEQFDLEGPGAD